MKLIQQGDVLFKMVDAMPAKLKKIESKRPGLITFAEGEVTGHHHSAIVDVEVERIDNIEVEVPNIILLEDDNGVLWCYVNRDAEVTHQEHNPVTLPPGSYQIGIVREVDHLADEIRAVAD